MTAPSRDARAFLASFAAAFGFRPWHLALPLGLSLIVAALDAFSLALLVPLSEGVARGDFEGAWRWPGLSSLPAARDALLARGLVNRGTFLLLVGLLLAAIVVRIGVQYAAAIALSDRSLRYASRARSHVMARLLSFGKLYFDRTSQAELSAMLGQAAAVAEGVRAIESTLAGALRLLAHVAVLLAISWPLTLVTAVVVPFVHRLAARLVGRLREASRTAHATERRLARGTFNLLASLSLVKVVSREAEARAEFDARSEQVRQAAFTRSALAGSVGPLGEALLLLALLGTTVAAVALTATEATTTLASLCAFLLIARQGVPLLGVFGRARAEAARLEPAVEQLRAVFDDAGKPFVTGGPREFTGVRRGIEIANLHFAFGERPVLRGLTAFLPAGRTTGIAGATGAGKTTLANLLARLYECPPGVIQVDGVDVREFSLSSFHRRVAVVSQEVWLVDDSLRNNVVFGLDEPPGDEAVRDALRRACLAPLLAALPEGLDTRIGDRGVRLSGGERQRLSIARALLRKADLVILDEATAAIDTGTEREIQQALTEALAGRTVVVVAHRLSTLRNADSILVLQDGRVVEQGRWESLAAAGGAFQRLLAAADVR